MTIDAWIVTVIIGISILAFAFELLRSDLVAILVMGSLIVTGVLTAEEATRGFSSPATLTVGCMFIISAVFVKAGLVDFTAQLLERWEKPSDKLAVFLLMAVVGTLSAFINNTAAVAVFIPIAIKLAKVSESSRKRFLMPLSFAAIFGGTCTLLGTSTNILVNSIYLEHGYSGFSMFEFAGIGVILSLVGMVYMMTAGRWLLGASETAEVSVKAHSYITAVKLLEDSPSVGKQLKESPFFEDFQANILSMERDGKSILINENVTLEKGDRFILLCSVEKIMSLRKRIGISILEGSVGEKEVPKDMHVFEVVVPNNSELVGQPLNHNGLMHAHGLIPLAVRHVQRTMFVALRKTKIAAGDVLIVAGKAEDFENFRGEENLLILGEPNVGQIDWRRMIFASLLLIGLIVSTSLGYLSVLGAAVVVCAVLLLTQSISLKKAYEALDSQVLILLACILSLGLALEKSGAAGLIANVFVEHAGTYGPYVILSGLYLATSLMTEIMSNNATAALMTPIALGIATSMGLGEKPFLLAVMLAGSASFMTPVGYQTNTLIFAPGGFRFSDFLKVGTPLNLLFWILATFLIPVFFPFTSQAL